MCKVVKAGWRRGLGVWREEGLRMGQRRKGYVHEYNGGVREGTRGHNEGAAAVALGRARAE